MSNMSEEEMKKLLEGFKELTEEEYMQLTEED